MRNYIKDLYEWGRKHGEKAIATAVLFSILQACEPKSSNFWSWHVNSTEITKNKEENNQINEQQRKNYKKLQLEKGNAQAEW
jgi:hypothetical protein